VLSTHAVAQVHAAEQAHVSGQLAPWNERVLLVV
jgi:hypothetical protein